jgi:hypothetical protein
MKSFANKVKVDDSKFQEQTSPQDNQDLCKIHTWIMKTFANKFKTKDPQVKQMQNLKTLATHMACSRNAKLTRALQLRSKRTIKSYMDTK